jgi:hypothetical protein
MGGTVPLSQGHGVVQIRFSVLIVIFDGGHDSVRRQHHIQVVVSIYEPTMILLLNQFVEYLASELFNLACPVCPVGLNDRTGVKSCLLLFNWGQQACASSLALSNVKG